MSADRGNRKHTLDKATDYPVRSVDNLDFGDHKLHWRRGGVSADTEDAVRVLVTGGAGYIGAHVVHALMRDGHTVAVLDDLSTGSRDRLSRNSAFFHGSVLDTTFVIACLRQYATDCVVHIAAKKAVEESIEQPLKYYRENVIGMHSLLTAMAQTEVQRIVFSSSAAVYESPPDGIVTEDSETAPSSPYGWTKLMCEQMIRDTAQAEQLSWVSLRYFNVGGAVASHLADRGENNLIPKVFRAVSSGTRPQIFGTSYPTRDGTCIRDYIHVDDVANAHASVVNSMENADLAATYNIGTGAGTSVLEVMLAVKRITGIDFECDVCAPRPGDPAQMVADPQRIRDNLGWQSRHQLDGIIESAWQAWRDAPDRDARGAHIP